MKQKIVRKGGFLFYAQCDKHPVIYRSGVCYTKSQSSGTHVLAYVSYRELVVTNTDENSPRRDFTSVWKEHPPGEIQDTCTTALLKMPA
jgi:uncharacterized protein (DUF2237 family)